MNAWLKTASNRKRTSIGSSGNSNSSYRSSLPTIPEMLRIPDDAKSDSDIDDVLLEDPEEQAYGLHPTPPPASFACLQAENQIFSSDNRRHIRPNIFSSSESERRESPPLFEEATHFRRSAFEGIRGLDNRVSSSSEELSNSYKGPFTSDRPSAVNSSTNWSLMNNFRASDKEQMSSNEIVNGSSDRSRKQLKTMRSSARAQSKGLTTGRRTDNREYVVSLIQYCANEVGLAFYHKSTGEFYVTQIIERMTYFKTISTIERFYPQEIIYSNTLEKTPLIRKLNLHFRRTAFRVQKRTNFDETKGYYIYSQRGNKDQYNPDQKFVAFAALHALVIYLESSFSAKFTYSAMQIRWHFLEDVLVIESQTVADLELFLNLETKRLENSLIQNFRCVTYGGTRMLRANILQPLANQAFIEQRLNCTEKLLANRLICETLTKEFLKFKNYEPITAKFIQNPKQQNLNSLKTYLSAILMLSGHCIQLKNLHSKLLPFSKDKIPVLDKLLHHLENPKLQLLRSLIQDNFNEEVLQAASKNNKYNIIFLFKLQKIDDEFAEISRLTYSHTVEDILRIFETIKQKSKEELKILYSESRGYYITAKNKVNLSEISQKIEDDIVHIIYKGSTVTFSTAILTSLNNRLKQNEKKLIFQSYSLLLKVIRQIQNNLDILFEINYSISQIDMIMSFVCFIAKYPTAKFTRPIFEEEVMTIKGLKTVWISERYSVPSQEVNISMQSSALAFLKDNDSFKQLNMLYSVAYLTILAQIGCLVPAQELTTQIFDVMLSKVHLQESTEMKLSHFQAQMHLFRNILENSRYANAKSLILLDEIVKGTQYDEQCALSLALTEQLCSKITRTVMLVSDKYLFSLMSRLKHVQCIQSEINAENHQKNIIQMLQELGFSHSFIQEFDSLEIGGRQVQPIKSTENQSFK